MKKTLVCQTKTDDSDQPKHSEYFCFLSCQRKLILYLITEWIAKADGQTDTCLQMTRRQFCYSFYHAVAIGLCSGHVLVVFSKYTCRKETLNNFSLEFILEINEIF